jgi:hypothetical protein
MHNDQKIMKHIEELYEFMASELNIKEKPEIELKHDEENAKDFYGKTAYYDPQEKKICLYVSGRHPKDIARSFAHELIHHMQNETEPLGDEDLHATSEVGYAQKNPKLNKMEEEAFTKGNMLFRKYTDQRKMAMEKNTEEKLKEVIHQLVKEAIAIDKKKADLNKYGKLSGYEKKRGSAIQKAMKGDKKSPAKQLAKKHAKSEVKGKRSEGPGKELINQSSMMKENLERLPVDDRLHPQEMQARDEMVWKELLRKFNIPEKKEE